jgi:hypothetical protein
MVELMVVAALGVVWAAMWSFSGLVWRPVKDEADDM